MASTWNSYQREMPSVLPLHSGEGLDIARVDGDAGFLRESVDPCEGVGTNAAFQGIIGGSLALKEVLDQVITVASTASTVLIEGETGTGKVLIARVIHSLSPRRDGIL
jgi:transcriptional regulator with GAF, ATPase, and Fis domain